MLALTTAGAWAFLLPADLKAFARSLTAVAAFYSNVLFAGQSGVANEGFAAYYLDHRLSKDDAELFSLIRTSWTARRQATSNAASAT